MKTQTPSDGRTLPELWSDLYPDVDSDPLLRLEAP